MPTGISKLQRQKMNERFQELAKQTQLCYNYLGLGSDRFNEYNTRLERFSTMLIEQCITHIISLESKLSLGYHGEWLGQELRKHYGIKNERTISRA